MEVIIGLVVCNLPYYHYSTLRKDSKYVDSYKKRYLNAPLSAPTEEILNSSEGIFYSPRRRDMKLRKNAMKLRKKEIEVRKSFFVPRWRIRVSSIDNFDFPGRYSAGDAFKEKRGGHRRLVSSP